MSLALASGARPTGHADEQPLRSLLSSILVLWRRSPLFAGLVVLMINSIPQYGFIVFSQSSTPSS